MTEHVDGNLRLLQNKVANEWFIFSVFRLHIYEQNFVVDRPEAFYLNADWTTHHIAVRLRCAWGRCGSLLHDTIER